MLFPERRRRSGSCFGTGINDPGTAVGLLAKGSFANRKASQTTSCCEVNHKLLRASLRHGRDRIHNGIRCATSLRSAEKLLRLLEPTVAPRVCLRRLGLDAEAAQQGAGVGRSCV